MLDRTGDVQPHSIGRSSKIRRQAAPAPTISTRRFDNFKPVVFDQFHAAGDIGWAMADHLRADLPLAALRMAIAAQRPGAGLIHHSDRGVQYASPEYRNALQSPGF